MSESESLTLDPAPAESPLAGVVREDVRPPVGRTVLAAALAAALGAGASAAAHDGLAEAQWMLGRVGEAVALREQAFAEHVRDGRCGEAARCAVWVAHQHVLGGHASAARGCVTC